MELKAITQIVSDNQKRMNESHTKLRFLYEKTLDMCDALGKGVDKDECMDHYANKIIPQVINGLNDMDKEHVMKHANSLVGLMDGYTAQLDNNTMDNVKEIMEDGQ